MNNSNGINYKLLFNKSMYGLIKECFQHISGNANPIHIILSFFTYFPKVVLPEYLKKEYPKIITIVLQHQFKNLTIDNDSIKITLTFKGVDENVSIPFNSIASYFDVNQNFEITLYNDVITPNSQNDTSSKTEKDNIIFLNKWKKPS